MSYLCADRFSSYDGLAVSFSASRSTGIGPLLVIFDATATTSGTTSYPFHELRYSWSFGDSGAGNWTYGNPSYKSKNAAIGAIAAHVFDITEGGGDQTFTVTLTVFNGYASKTATTTITVYDPAGANGYTATHCFSTSNNYTGAPAGATTHGTWSTGFGAAINTYGAAGRRILFRTGETFSGATSAALSYTGPWAVGKFGGSTLPLIQFAGTSGNTLSIGAGAGVFPTDGRIMDLNINGASSAAPTDIHSVNFTGNMDQCLVYRCNVHDIGDGVNLGIDAIELAGNTHVWDQIGIVDCTIQTITGGGGTHGVDAFSTRFALMGCLINDTTAAEHLMRLDYLYKAVVQHNKATNGAASKETLAIRGLQQDPNGSFYKPYVGAYPSPTQYVIVSDNELQITTGNGVIEYKAANSAFLLNSCDMIVERNWMYGTNSNGAIQTNSNRITIRNNIINSSNWDAGGTGMVVGNAADTMIPAGQNIWIYNNSGYASTTEASGFVYPASIANTTILRNNLDYLPSSGGPFVCAGGNCAAVTSSNNSTVGQMATPSCYTDSTPSLPSEFAPTAYAIGGGLGTVQIFDDYNGAQRTYGNTAPVLDMGALKA